MTFGPYQQYPPNAYLVDFFLRSPSPTGKMATIDVYDAQSGQILASINNSLEFRTYWYGAANMDVAAIRVHRP